MRRCGTHGEWRSLREACAEAGQPYDRVMQRLHAGWSLQEALATPKGGRWHHQGTERPLPPHSLAAAIQRYLAAHPEEARRLAQKYGWTDP
jgi:hypothetical protein